MFTDSLGTELSHHGNLITLKMMKDMIVAQHQVFKRTLPELAFFDLEMPAYLSPDIDIESRQYSMQKYGIYFP